MENKIKYITPQIKLIILDNEISLALESAPPIGPGESREIMPDYLRNNPFPEEKA